jgi:hypothetical protein
MKKLLKYMLHRFVFMLYAWALLVLIIWLDDTVWVCALMDNDTIVRCL